MAKNLIFQCYTGCFEKVDLGNSKKLLVPDLLYTFTTITDFSLS